MTVALPRKVVCEAKNGLTTHLPPTRLPNCLSIVTVPALRLGFCFLGIEAGPILGDARFPQVIRNVVLRSKHCWC